MFGGGGPVNWIYFSLAKNVGQTKYKEIKEITL